MKWIVLLSVLCVALVGCSTMAPRTPDEAALVIPVQLHRETTRQLSGQYRLKIDSPTDPSFERVGVVTFQHSYHLFTGLKPGRYRLAEVTYWYPEAATPAWRYKVDATLELPAGTLTILPWCFDFRLFEDQQQKRLTLTTDFSEVTVELATRILRHLTEREGYEEWTLNPATAALESVKAALAGLGT